MRPFNSSKQKVRELNLRLVTNHLEPPFRYFGLPSPQMDDIEVYRPHLACVHAVERGVEGQEWRAQHDLAVTAIIRGYPRFRLFRGDIDEMLLQGKDVNGQKLDWPYDLINLDYTGGIVYKENPISRVKAIQKAIEEQGIRKARHVLIITVNDRHHDEGEINNVLDDLSRQCGGTADAGRIGLIKKHEDHRMAVFLYTAFVVITTGRLWYQVTTFKPILYLGRSRYRMLNMGFLFEPTRQRDAPAKGANQLCKLFSLEPIEITVRDNLIQAHPDGF